MKREGLKLESEERSDDLSSFNPVIRANEVSENLEKKQEQDISIKRLPPTATRRVNLNKNKQKHQKKPRARAPASKRNGPTTHPASPKVAPKKIPSYWALTPYDFNYKNHILVSENEQMMVAKL